MAGSVLEVMGATAGALALLDRLIENPKGRTMNKRKFSAKQIAAQKLFAKRAKAGEFSNPSRRTRALSSAEIRRQFDDLAAITSKDVRRRFAGSTYTLENYASGWILRADGVAIGGPYETFEKGMNALDSVAPKENPRGRSKRPVGRKSQATGERPTKRLVARREKTKRAPKGMFANPILAPTHIHTFVVQISRNGRESWSTVGGYTSQSEAFRRARDIAKSEPSFYVRVMSRREKYRGAIQG
jgi:hypothetical protein